MTTVNFVVKELPSSGFIGVYSFAARKTDSPAGESPVVVNDDKPSSNNRRGA
jgi:hypothetical protein